MLIYLFILQKFFVFIGADQRNMLRNYGYSLRGMPAISKRFVLQRRESVS